MTTKTHFADAKDAVTRLQERAQNEATALALNKLLKLKEAEVHELEQKVAELEKDAGRYRWLCEDHDSPDVRKKRNEILDRMSVMSYSAASQAIDAAMNEGQK
jgi:hypothetical protein